MSAAIAAGQLLTPGRRKGSASLFSHCEHSDARTCILLDTADLLRSVFPLLDLLPGLVHRRLCQAILQ